MSRSGDDPTVPSVQFIDAAGAFAPNEHAERYQPFLDRLTETDLQQFYRDMANVRAFDIEATNLQRQGQMALWPPSHGQEAAQVGSARAARAQDHIFPSYREHVVAMIRGVDPIDIVRLMRGNTHGGWDPADPSNGNMHLYTLVLAAQTLHATGYAMGLNFDKAVGTGDPDRDTAVLVYFGDGSSSEGDANEAYIYAASYQTPQVFFLQNNQWAISVPVSRQAREPLYQRAAGFGLDSVRIDGNDVLASYATAAKHLDDARAGHGPSLIEAMTYRVGAHTTSDDPTKYRTDDELQSWIARDPIVRFKTYLQGLGASDAFFAEVDEEAAALAEDTRVRTLALEAPGRELIFDGVYSEPHPLMVEQQAWLERYEASLEGGNA